MRIFLFILYFSGVSSCLFAQVQRKTYHDLEKKQVKEIYYVTDSITNILQGPYKSFYLNGEPESKGQFEKNEATGLWEFYFETGVLKTRARVQAGTGNDGFYEYYFENGNKSMEGLVEKQLQTGYWKFYFENGDLKEEGFFIDGLRHGEWKTYFEDSQLAAITTYKEGVGERREYFASGDMKGTGQVKGTLKTGPWFYYDNSGKKQAEGSYSKDKRNGEWKYYHENGEVASNGAYDDNAAVGIWNYFDSTGNLTSRGAFKKGSKEGNWEIYYPGGSLKGSVSFHKGSGEYKEYYESGALRATGFIEEGLSAGDWVYYYEDGEIEGNCTFERGRGTYTGFYRNGAMQTRGTIEDGKRIGRWELFDEEGVLTGYYKPIYEGDELINVPVKKDRPNIEYGVADYKFKGSRKGYFTRRLNEFNGLIAETNPLMSLIGSVPVSMELYMQDRLGYKLDLQGIRNPFFKSDDDIALNETYERGYQVAIQQRFYNPAYFGLWYFGHELRFTNLRHYSRVELNPGEIDKISATEKRIDYSGLLGYRVLGVTNEPGFTMDCYLSAGVGFRDFEEPDYFASLFSEVDKDSFSFRFGFGLTFGYVFAFGKNRRR